MRKSLVLSALASLALTGPAMAGDFSYSYLEGNLFGDAIDDTDGDFDLKGGGLGGKASWGIGHAMYGFANLDRAEYEYYELGTDDEDFSTFKLGVGLGFRIPLGRKLDLVTGLSLQRLRTKKLHYDATFNDEGYGIDVGLRGLIGERLQWTVNMHRVDYDEIGHDKIWSTGFRYYFTRTFAMGLDVASTDKDQASALIAFRWDVGNR